MKRKELDRYAFVLVLLAASLFSLTPARADQDQSQVGTVVFHLTGQATSMNTTGSLGSAILDLAGGGLDDGQGGLMIQNLTGNLQIGSANYSIFTGDGRSDTLGELMMIGESSSGELVLQGIIQYNSTVTTNATLSRLSTLAYLALSGSMTLGDTTSGSVMNGELTQNVTSTVENTSVNSSVSSSIFTQSESSSSSFAPAQADEVRSQIGTVVIHLTGQATSMDNITGPSGSTTLDLAGGIRNDGNGGLIIQNLTGSLQIGPANYTISTGHGDSNRLGIFVIFGDSSFGELVLHGTIQNNSTMITDSPPSRLSSLAYLALSGSMILNNTGSDSAVNVSQNAISTTVMENRTSTNSTSEITQSESSTLSIANVTSQSEVSNTTQSMLTTSIANSTSLNQTIANAMPEQNNITITTTQLNNQTITVYVTNTVANYTVTQATTTTVANITITQFSSSTVSNTTVIVTNSTTSGP